MDEKEHDINESFNPVKPPHVGWLSNHHLLGGFILFAAFAAVVAYLYYLNNLTINSSLIVSNLPIQHSTFNNQGKAIYWNDTYGYLFQYSDNVDDQHANFFEKNSAKEINLYNGAGTYPNTFSIIALVEDPELKNKKYDEVANKIWLINKTDPYGAGKTVGPIEKTNLNGSPSVTFDIAGSFTENEKGEGYLLNHPTTFTYFESNGVVMQMSYTKESKVFQEIAKSVTVIPQDYFFKTYNNSNFRFTLRYPESYKVISGSEQEIVSLTSTYGKILITDEAPSANLEGIKFNAATLQGKMIKTKNNDFDVYFSNDSAASKYIKFSVLPANDAINTIGQLRQIVSSLTYPLDKDTTSWINYDVSGIEFSLPANLLQEKSQSAGKTLFSGNGYKGIMSLWVEDRIFNPQSINIMYDDGVGVDGSSLPQYHSQNSTWYETTNGDAGCVASDIQTAYNKKTLHLSFGYCYDPLIDNPSVVPIYKDAELKAKIISTFKI